VADLAAAGLTPMRFCAERVIYLVLRESGEWHVADELLIGGA
jgi:hypothetical protein